jgi:uncharacterized protein
METSISPSNIHQNRQAWIYQRKIQEEKIKNKKLKIPFSGKRISKLDLAIQAFAGMLRVTGLYGIGKKSAMNFEVKHLTISFPQLPESFDGYTILHLTDLHLDTLPGMEDRVVELISGLKYDLCVWTGDYRRDTHGEYRHVLPGLEKIARAITAPDGTLVTLGNHDTWQMVEPLSQMGLKVMINESLMLQRNGEEIMVTGTDDPHYFYSMGASKSLHTPKTHFKIALIHSPELYDEAAKNGYHLYLCGHTHAGQVCLPNGKPLITHLHKGEQFYHGLWQHKQMTGYTSSGCGISGIPVRFFSQGEITMITLKKEG